MAEKIDKLTKQIDYLVQKGKLLLFSMANDLANNGFFKEEEVSIDLLKSEIKNLELPNFISEYETWYSEALQVIKQIIPDRLDDFVRQYNYDKRKEITSSTYCISDYFNGTKISRGGNKIVDPSNALSRMQNQFNILNSAQVVFKSSLLNIQEVLQVDLFDSELEAAKALNKNGFTRAAGAMVGVVLEKHLSHVCEHHIIKSYKKHPTIADFNDILKDNNIIDTPKWRYVQHLGDLRNLCDHHKDREPTKDDVAELIEGVDKVIKTVH